MRRLKYPYKFALIGILASISIISLFTYLWIDVQGTLEVTQKEISGVTPIQTSVKLLQHMQLHRELASNVKSLSPSELKEKYTLIQKSISEEMTEIDAINTHDGNNLNMTEPWKEIKTKWETLQTKGGNLSAAENIAQHNDIIKNILTLIDSIDDASGLILDPDLDSYFVMDLTTIRIPKLSEYLNQLKLLGMQTYAKKNISDQEKRNFIEAVAYVRLVSGDLKISLDKIISSTPTFEKPGKEFEEKFTGELNKLLEKSETDILTGTFNSDAQEFLKSASYLPELAFYQSHESLFPLLNKLLNDRLNKAYAQLYFQGGVATVAILLLVYFAIGAYFTILNGVQSLSKGTENLAKGDLTTRVRYKSNDELQLVADNFNVMADNMSRLVKDIRNEAHHVLSSASLLSNSSQEVLKGSATQSDSAASMAAAVEEMTVSVEEINRHAQNAQMLSQKAGELSTEGNKVVSSVVNEMNALAETVNKSATVIQALGEQSEKISAIVNAIKQIADQTNLLALNAAIEAARAGESGRGFAVVADEVRKLAERTAEATQEIGEMIGAIQTGTNNAVISMQEGVTRVSHGVDLVHQAGNSMNEVTNASNEVVRVVGDISIALKEQSIANTEIAKNVERIAQMAEHNHVEVSNAATTAKDLEQLAAKLQAGINQFKVN